MPALAYAAGSADAADAAQRKDLPALRTLVSRKVNVNDPGYPFLAVVEHTNYMPPADYGGRHLMYPEGTPMSNLLLTILNKAGVQQESVGDSNGLLSDV